MSLTKSQIEKRIAELKATERVMVGSTSGTHSTGIDYTVWATIDGNEYATKSAYGANAEPCSMSEIEHLPLSKGRLRDFRNNRQELAAKRNELARLEKALRSVQ
jgi:hypothetical protein